MQFGLVLPNFASWFTPDNIRATMSLAEELGYESVWVNDHVLFPDNLSDHYGNEFKDPLALLGAAAVLGVMIGAVQLLPSIEFFGDSARAVWSRDQALSFSLSPWNLVQLWSPFFFEHRVYAPGEDLLPHEFIVYNGEIGRANV